jgi:tellurite resistance protein TerC
MRRASARLFCSRAGGEEFSMMDMGSLWTWVLFIVFVLAMLALDLGVFHRKAHKVSVREATIWTTVWIALAMVFNVLIYFWEGADPALKFFTGYVIEKSLSVDNIFVFVLIFTTFRVPAEYQHRVLFWGILGALVMRGLFIGLGTALINRFEWIIYIFGAFLVFTGIKMALQKEEGLHPEENPVVGFFRRFVPMTPGYEGTKFFVKKGGRWLATPLMLVLMIVETTDVIFAVDSIPAIFAITTDPFLVFTSNVFAILGLRALYFLLAGIIDKFHYLKLALSVILSYVGIKMLISGWYHIPTGISLGFIALSLTLAVIASLLRARKLEQTSDAIDPTEITVEDAQGPIPALQDEQKETTTGPREKD